MYLVRISSTGPSFTLVLREIAVESNAQEWQISLNIPEEHVQAGVLLWSPDGQKLLLAVAHTPYTDSWSHSILLVDVGGLSVTTLLDHDINWPRAIRWPELDAVEVTARNGRLWLLNPTTGSLQEKD